MLDTDLRMHKHLRRLERVWIDWPIFFITTCTFRRRAILASNEAAGILVDEWRNAHDRHGWAIGRYVIMPEHVHFFCSAELGAKALPTFMRAWKQWTSKRAARELNLSGTVWQEEFFDHVLRSSESYSQKWDYVKENPVRAGLVKNSDEWPWQGEIESLML
jgi:REP element-mobilizing transposase RayT